MKLRSAAVVVSCVAALLAALLVGEGVLRVWSQPDDEQRDAAAAAARDVRLAAPCAAEQSDGNGRRVVARSRLQGRTFDVALERAPGTLRVAVVGESTGTMLGAAMKDLVARSPHAAVEVLNCAIPGASLEHAAQRATEVMRYSPDVVIVAFGHDLEIEAPTAAWRVRLEHLVASSRMLSGALARFSPPAVAGRADRAKRLEQLAHWLHELAREARATGITVIVQTIASNLWIPPHASPEALDDEEFLAARLEYARGARVAAIQRLGALVTRRDDPYWHFVLGTWLARTGDRKRAREHLQAAVDLAPENDRAPSAVNETIRRVAGEDSLVLRDTESSISVLARQGIPGWDVMRDQWHLKPSLFEAEAREVLLLARRAVGPDKPLELSDTTAPWPSRADVERALDGIASAQVHGGHADAERWAHAAGYAVEEWLGLGYTDVDAAIDEVLAGAEFARVRDEKRRACVLTAVAQGYWHGGRKERAVELSDLALSAPSAEARVERALLELSRGRTDVARQMFAEALALDHDRTDARFFLDKLSERQAAGPRASKRRAGASLSERHTAGAG